MIVRIGRLLSFCFLAMSCQPGASTISSGGGGGHAGSMSRFAITNDVLYAINGANLQLFTIGEPENPIPWNTVWITRGIETLFTHDDHLFVGAQNGMYIYDSSTPLYPYRLGEFTHSRGCDPVVVQGTVAYVTLRGGSRCWRESNRLDLIDIENLEHPELIQSYAMQNPKGLGIDDNNLFVCDGIAGLKHFDASMPEAITLIEQKAEIDCYDVIPDHGVLIISADDGIHQYDYSNNELSLLSRMALTE